MNMLNNVDMKMVLLLVVAVAVIYMLHQQMDKCSRKEGFQTDCNKKCISPNNDGEYMEAQQLSKQIQMCENKIINSNKQIQMCKNKIINWNLEYDKAENNCNACDKKSVSMNWDKITTGKLSDSEKRQIFNSMYQDGTTGLARKINKKQDFKDSSEYMNWYNTYTSNVRNKLYNPNDTKINYKCGPDKDAWNDFKIKNKNNPIIIKYNEAPRSQRYLNSFNYWYSKQASHDTSMKQLMDFIKIHNLGDQNMNNFIIIYEEFHTQCS